MISRMRGTDLHRKGPPEVSLLERHTFLQSRTTFSNCRDHCGRRFCQTMMFLGVSWPALAVKNADVAGPHRGCPMRTSRHPTARVCRCLRRSCSRWVGYGFLRFSVPECSLWALNVFGTAAGGAVDCRRLRIVLYLAPWHWFAAGYEIS